MLRKRQKDAIYKLIAKTANNFIQVTDTNLKTIIYNRLNNTKIHYKTNTALSLHHRECKHVINFDNIQILHKLNNYYKRKVLETIYISKNRPKTINARNKCQEIGKFYTNVLELILFE